MKKTPSPPRRRSPELRQAPIGQQKLCTGKEAAEILRRFEKMTTPQERRLMAEGIEDLRVRMNCDLPDAPEWDKVENAFGQAAYKKLRQHPRPK